MLLARLLRLVALSSVAIPPSTSTGTGTGRLSLWNFSRHRLVCRCCSKTTGSTDDSMSKKQENRQKNKSKRRQRGDPYDEAQYMTTPDGVRMVVPYTHNFTTYAKGRWIGREIIEVLTREFGGHPKEYWTNALRRRHRRPRRRRRHRRGSR